MKKLLLMTALCILASVPVAAQGGGATPGTSQTPTPADSLSTYLKNTYKSISKNLIGSAEQMPEANYKMKLGTMPEVRTFGATLGHIISSNYFYCARAKGEAVPDETDYETTTQTKDQLVKAMHEAVSYCSSVYESLTEATITQTVLAKSPTGPGRLVMRIQVLITNIGHNDEEYGKLVGYFRTANIVPPSSAPINSTNGGK
jgi:DinB superfamily